MLVSSSRDSLIKFWDLDIQHCFSTLAGHISEVWDFAIVKGGGYLVSGSGDSELRVWRLTFKVRGLFLQFEVWYINYIARNITFFSEIHQQGVPSAYFGF